MQRLKELEDKNAALQAALDALDSKTVAGIKGDINTLYAKLAQAADEEERAQQERNRLQTEVNKAGHVLAAKEEVVLGKKATLQAMDEELLQLKAGTAAVAKEAQREATRAAQLRGNVGCLRAAATTQAGEIQQHRQVRTDLLAACSVYEQLLGHAAANAAGDADVEQP
jgi:chromosome segregation ATPase